MARGPGDLRVIGSGAVSSALQRGLVEWSEATRRDLPWRRTRDPWAVLVSELMLQQTQVARVAPRWTAFLEEFPDPAASATTGGP